MRFRSLVFALVMIASSSYAEPRGLADTLGHWFRWNDAGTCVFFDYNEDKMLSTGEECVARSGVVNVKDFGAKGDGVTDDTAEIQAAIDATEDDGTNCFDGSGGVVFFPPGDYIVSSTINVPGCVLLKGQHRTSTTISASSGFTASNAAVITLCQDSVTTFGHGCAIESISVDQNSVADWGVMTTNGNEGSYIKDFVIRRIDVYGIYLKSRAGSDPGNHGMAIEDGEILIGPANSGDRGIRVESNTFGPVDASIRRVTVTADTTVANAIAIDIAQSGFLLESIHMESFETGIYVGVNNVTMNQVRCTSDVTTCVRMTTGSVGTSAVFGLRLDAGAGNALVDDYSSVTIPAGSVVSYMQAAQVGGSLQPPRGTASVVTCVAAFEGTIYYDTNVGTPDGALCHCTDNSGAFIWEAVDAAVVETTPTATDCGT